MSERAPREPISGTKLFFIIWGPVPVLMLLGFCAMEVAQDRAISDRVNVQYEAMTARQEAENATANLPDP